MSARRPRNIFLYGGALAAVGLSLYSDPDGGLATAVGGIAMAQGIWAVAAAFFAMKMLMDYPAADGENLFKEAKKSATGAGLALIAKAIILVGLLVVFAPRAHSTEIPAGALQYGPTLQAEQQKYWPDHPDPALLFALVEQESCISLKHSKCWNPQARLKSDREEGAGFGQITRAYRADGSVRFDSLTDMRSRYAPLADWSWQNVYARPDLQLRAMVLMSRDNARSFRQTNDPLGFGDAAYNGGLPDVQRERRACELSPGCNAKQWFDNVEKHCLKSKQPIYGKRSACDINREHVRMVILVRPGKYRVMLAGRFK